MLNKITDDRHVTYSLLAWWWQYFLLQFYVIT